MMALGTRSVRRAVAAMDAEHADYGLAGNVGLELLDDIVLDERPMTVRTAVGQVGLVEFRDLITRRGRPMAVDTVDLTRLATRRLGTGRGRPFA